MPKSLIFLAFLALTGVSGTAFGQNAPSTEAALAHAKACMQPWLDGVEEIIARFPEVDAILYRNVLMNSPVAEPITHQGQQAVRYLSEAKNDDMPSVILVSVCSGDPGASWANTRGLFAEYYPDYDALVMRNEFQVPPMVRGLVLMHEMRHVYVSQAGFRTSALANEEDAYDYEFKVLDGLKLPGYADFIDDEVVRLRKSLRTEGTFEPNYDDPRIETMFGSGADSTGRKAIASIILIRAMFKLYDLDAPPGKASFMKQEYLRAIGY